MVRRAALIVLPGGLMSPAVFGISDRPQFADGPAASASRRAEKRHGRVGFAGDQQRGPAPRAPPRGSARCPWIGSLAVRSGIERPSGDESRSGVRIRLATASSASGATESATTATITGRGGSIGMRLIRERIRGREGPITKDGHRGDGRHPAHRGAEQGDAADPALTEPGCASRRRPPLRAARRSTVRRRSRRGRADRGPARSPSAERAALTRSGATDPE